jgi:hypothetical protein
MEIWQLEFSSIAPSFTMMQPPIPVDLQVGSMPPMKTLTNPMPKPTQPVLKPFTSTGIVPSLPMMKPIVPIHKTVISNVTLPSKKSTLPVNPTSIPDIATSTPAPQVQPNSATVFKPAENPTKSITPVAIPTRPPLAQLKSFVLVAANKVKQTKLLPVLSFLKPFQVPLCHHSS